MLTKILELMKPDTFNENENFFYEYLLLVNGIFLQSVQPKSPKHEKWERKKIEIQNVYFDTSYGSTFKERAYMPSCIFRTKTTSFKNHVTFILCHNIDMCNIYLCQCVYFLHFIHRQKQISTVLGGYRDYCPCAKRTNLGTHFE